MDAVSSLETGLAALNSRSLTRFYRKLIVISLLFEIFRRLNAHFSPFYTPIAVDAVFHLGDKPCGAKFASIYSILSKITRYFGTFWDFLTFKRTFYSILYADRNGSGFQLGNRPRCAKFVNIYSIIPIITRYFFTFWDISTLKRTFYSIFYAECSAHYMQCGNKAGGSHIWKHLTDFTEN